MGKLDGKVTVITGAGSGIGRAAAGAFVAGGAIGGLLGRNAPAVKAAASALGVPPD